MKKLITMAIMVLAVCSLMAQASEKFSYQTVVRNANNALVTNASVGVRVSVLQGSANGNAVYVETYTATTNANGLITLQIGGGTVQPGTFVGIDWADGPFFLKTETDPAGYYGFYGTGHYANFWSSTQDDSYDAYSRYLYYGYPGVRRYDSSKTSGYSVRCLRD